VAFLYLFAVLRGFVFWYGIEKLFQLHIGLNFQQIVVIGIIAQASQVIFELPTSIVADRWSRRNILIIAHIAMIASCIVIALSKNFGIYSIGVILWACFNALSSGVYEAFAYDYLATRGQKNKFRQVYTRLVSSELLTLALTGLIAGVISRFFSLQLNFFLTIPFFLASIMLLLGTEEPPIKRTTDIGLTWTRHLREAFGVMRSDFLRSAVIIYTVLLGLQAIWYEYYQLVGIDVKVPTIVFGSMIGILTLGMMAGAEIAHKWRASRGIIFKIWLVLIITQLIGLRVGIATLALGNIFIAFVAFRALRAYLEIILHDRIESHVRATIFSLASTAGYAIFFVLALAFTFLLPHIGIRSTLTIISLPLLALGLTDIMKRIGWIDEERTA
jgi:MFS family permease